MRLYKIYVKGYCKGTKEQDYIMKASSEATAVSRALKDFKADFKGLRFDEIHIKVIL